MENNKLKILYITSDFLFEVGGISQHIQNLSYNISKSENVSCIYLNQKGKHGFIKDEFNRKIYYVPHKGSQLERFFNYPSNQINKIISNEKPDLIHIHTLFDAFKINVPNIPMIFTNHSSSYLKMYNNLLIRKFILPKVLSKFKMVISPSTELREKTIHTLVKMIPNGVDTERFNISKRSEINKIETLKKYQVNYNNETILLSTRRLVDKNGILDFVKNNINYFKNEKVIYLIVGDGEHFEEISKIKKENNIGNIYLLGKMENKDIDPLYFVSDYCIIPSKMEAISISALEAMSSGCVVIANKVGGLEELITENVNGIFLKNLSLKESLNLDKETYNSIQNKAFEEIVNNFSWQMISNKTLETYNSIL